MREINGAFIHPHALCESTSIGPRTRVWAFAHILPGATIGADCNICDHVFVENDVVIGSRVTVKCGVQLWDGLRVSDDVFVGPNATFSNDKYPRSRDHERPLLQTHVDRGASIGGGAAILPGLRIGADAMVGSGSVVTHDVPARAIVSGNPARIVGYVEASRRTVELTPVVVPPAGSAITPTSVRGVTVHRLREAVDLRGSLTVGEFTREVPFTPRRYFLTYAVPGKEVRGEHAHRTCHQFLVCAHGSVSVVADDGVHREEVMLERPHLGLYLPPLTWAVQYKYSASAVLLVFASDYYEPADYIREYAEFLDTVKPRSG